MLNSQTFVDLKIFDLNIFSKNYAKKRIGKLYCSWKIFFPFDLCTDSIIAKLAKFAIKLESINSKTICFRYRWEIRHKVEKGFLLYLVAPNTNRHLWIFSHFYCFSLLWFFFGVRSIFDMVLIATLQSTLGISW